MNFTVFLASLLFATPGQAGEVIVRLSPDIKVRQALAVNRTDQSTISGKQAGSDVRFDKLQPSVTYDLSIETADGRIEQGVDSGWYNTERASANAEPMDDEDRQQIDAILKDIRSFYDRTEALAIWGDHDRAVVLVQRIRDSAFHSDKGGECIWRVELWYLKNEAGGWAKVNQQDRVLRRERFESSAKMNAEIARVRWRAELGGVRVGKEEAKTITLAVGATTQRKEP